MRQLMALKIALILYDQQITAAWESDIYKRPKLRTYFIMKDEIWVELYDNSSYDVTPHLTQEGVEFGGECIPVV